MKKFKGSPEYRRAVETICATDLQIYEQAALLAKESMKTQ
jgi:hypothetical protein